MLRKIEYNPKWNGQKFNQYDTSSIERLTGNPINELLALTGIYGCPYTDNLKISIEGEYPILSMTVYNDFIHLTRTVDIRTRTITNVVIEIKIQGKGVGLNVFTNQVAAAEEAGIHFIKCEAAKAEYGEGKYFIGYKVWGKFGYLMDQSSHTKFIDLMNQHGRLEKSLHELYYLQNSKGLYIKNVDGAKFWEDYGDAWNGIFTVERKSLSRELLQTYILSKIIRKKISDSKKKQGYS